MPQFEAFTFHAGTGPHVPAYCITRSAENAARIQASPAAAHTAEVLRAMAQQATHTAAS